MGKSGHIARKIAATLSATGTPSYFVHPAESSHGDLGMLMRGDCLLALSNSGATPELEAILSYATRLEIPIVGIASREDSPLARQSNIYLHLPKAEEACPVKIAPTTSTTMTLALGDALAIAVMRIRGTSLQDLAQLHPGGNIGRRLMPVDQLIRPEDPLPLVRPNTRMRDVIMEMTSSGKGVAGVVDDEGGLIGIITDGDLRREFDRITIATAGDIMTREPITIPHGMLVEDAYILLNDGKVMVAFVMDAHNPTKPAGLVHIHDMAVGIA
jgi:arabinose-5-phosphate isomerase